MKQDNTAARNAEHKEKKMDVLLIAGGWSPEREISLLGAKGIEKVLSKRGHTVTFFNLSDGFEALIPLAEKAEVAFINLHGSPGEDGLVQALLSRLNCPYQGSNAEGSFLALHKYAAKSLLQAHGLNTVKGMFLPAMPENPEEIEAKLSYPMFVKSNNGGSSIHLYRVTNRQELKNALETMFGIGLEILIEELAEGKEVTCGVLDGKALPPVLIESKAEFFDYTNKYSADGAAEICPAPIGAEATRKIQEMALKAHNALGLSDYSRSDFILTKEGIPYILEVNTLPGMTSASLVPKEAKEIGLSFGELIEKLLELAKKKKNGYR